MYGNSYEQLVAEIGMKPVETAAARGSGHTDVPDRVPRREPSPWSSRHRLRWLTVLLAMALSYLIMYAALLGVLYASPTLGNGLSGARNSIREYLVVPRSTQVENLGFLSGRERSHLRDVKLIFDAAFALALTAVAVLFGGAAAVARRRHDLIVVAGRVLWSSGISAVALILILGVAAWLDFHRFWQVFHRVLFPQGNWQFPNNSMLIRIYPESFFEAFVLRWIVVVVSGSLVLAWFGRHLSARPRP